MCAVKANILKDSQVIARNVTVNLRLSNGDEETLINRVGDFEFAPEDVPVTNWVIDNQGILTFDFLNGNTLDFIVNEGIGNGIPETGYYFQATGSIEKV